MEKSKKAAHRPVGSPDKKSSVLRNEICIQFRCSEGFNKTVDELMATAGFKSRSDVYHEAVKILADRKLPATFFWINKIQ